MQASEKAETTSGEPEKGRSALLTCRPEEKAVGSGAPTAEVAVEVKAGEEGNLGGDSSSKEFKS